MVAASTPVDLTPVAPPVRTLTAADLDGLAEELAAYHAHFAPLFRRPEQRVWAGVYLRGLLTADVPRKNVEALALRVPAVTACVTVSAAATGMIRVRVAVAASTMLIPRRGVRISFMGLRILPSENDKGDARGSGAALLGVRLPGSPSDA